MKLSWALWIVALTSCGELRSETEAVRTAERAHFSSVRVTGKHGVLPFSYGCPNDLVAFQLTGKDATGKMRLLTACCGILFEGCSIH